MAPTDVPHHWKQTQEILDTVLFPTEDEDEPEDESEDEVLIYMDSLDSEEEYLLVVEDLSESETEGEYLLVVEDLSGSETDSFAYFQFSDESQEHPSQNMNIEASVCSSPISTGNNCPRRRLFGGFSSDDDDDGVEYLEEDSD